MTARALLFSRDPGGTNVMIALNEVLTEAGALPLHPAKGQPLEPVTDGGPGPQAPAGRGAAPRRDSDLARLLAPFTAAAPLVVAKDYAVAAWQRAGIVPAPWPGAAALDDWLREAGIGAVLTATSDVDDDSPQLLWQAARRAGLPSACFLDLPANLAGRFRLRSSGAVIHPDLVFAWDDAMAAALTAAGVPAARIRCCGNLHLLRLRRLAAAVPAEAVAGLRAAWGAVPGERVLLFVSDCGREIAAAGRPMPFDEIDLLDRLLAAVAGDATRSAW